MDALSFRTRSCGDVGARDWDRPGGRTIAQVFADCIRSFTTVCVGIAAVGWKNQVNGAQADSIGALVCSATIFFLALGLFQQWFKALKVYLNYDRYEHTELARPSTRAQGIARILSAATTYDEVQK